MGPVLIFDKSTLQSLNVDEAMWLDNFFLSNITPLFFIETLADLEKEMRSGRTPEQVVGNLALKTPDMSAKPNIHHLSLLTGELLGHAEVDMRFGRPIISGGQTMELGGQMGIIFQPSPEEEAFQRWQKQEFLEVERTLAKSWRADLSNVDLEEKYKLFQQFFGSTKPKTFDDVKVFADSIIDGANQESILRFGLTLLGVPLHSQVIVLKRWQAVGMPQVREFAPYFTHVFSVDLFFYLSIAADLIGRGRPSHTVDIAYLYYLPFCMVFSSGDNLHEKLAPFFLKERQTFVRAADLKKDLGRLDAYFAALPEEVKARGVMSFAFYPPTDDSFLVTDLWDKHMSKNWRQHKVEPKPQPSDPRSDEILKEINRFEKEAKPVAPGIANADEAHHMIIQRTVMARKGKWTRFPPEVINRRKNANGEWEDIEPTKPF